MIDQSLPLTAPALPAVWRARAEELERFCPPAAVAFREAALALESALRAQADEVLTLAEAALASGLSADRLRHKIAAGEIPNAGRKGAPRVRRADLPTRPTPTTPALYDVDQDARRLTLGGMR